MNRHRRSCLTLLTGVAGSVAICPFVGARAAAPRSLRPQRGFYDATNAPDALSRQVLSRPLGKLHHGIKPGEATPQALHRNFASLIEQNLAWATSAQISSLFDGLDQRTLMALAQSYLNATEFQGRQPLGLQILAHRLDSRRLAHLARFFGAARMLEAILRVAPEKVELFNIRADLNSLGPRAHGVQSLSLQDDGRPGAGTSGNLSMLDYSIYEIYLAYRTAPIGATSVAASFYQTSMYAVSHLSVAWGFGYAAGSLLALGMQTYTPSLWDRLVDGIGAWIELLNQPPQIPPDSFRSPEEQSGIKQRDGYLYAFDLGPARYDDFAIGGGDYGSTDDWVDYVPYEPFPAAPVCGPLEDSCGEIHPLRRRAR